MVEAARPGGKRVGYIRVSSVDQKDLRQLDGLELDKIFRDKASGKDTQRPELQHALQYLRDGDVLVAHSMERLALLDAPKVGFSKTTAQLLKIPSFVGSLCSYEFGRPGEH